MKQYCLKIRSKNEKSLKNFSHFFFKHLKTKFNIIKKPSTTPAKQKLITFLKSPHVNKTAQEHFEIDIFTKKVFIKGSFLEKNFIFLKKILIKLFQDISIHLEITTNEKVHKKNSLSIFHPNNFKFSKSLSPQKNFKRYKQKTVIKKSSNQKSSLLRLLKLLNTISIFGEILLISPQQIIKPYRTSNLKKKLQTFSFTL